jgi:hypothetical protein
MLVVEAAGHSATQFQRILLSEERSGIETDVSSPSSTPN